MPGSGAPQRRGSQWHEKPRGQRRVPRESRPEDVRAYERRRGDAKPAQRKVSPTNAKFLEYALRQRGPMPGTQHRAEQITPGQIDSAMGGYAARMRRNNPGQTGFGVGPGSPPVDPTEEAIQNMIASLNSATPAVDLATYLKPYADAEAQLNKTAMLAGGQINKNAGALGMVLGARNAETQAGQDTLSNSLDANIAASRAELPLGNSTATPIAQVNAERTADLSELARMQSDIKVQSQKGLDADVISQGVDRESARTDAQAMLEANKLAAMLKIGQGRAEATNQYNVQTNQAQTDTEAKRFQLQMDLLKYQGDKANAILEGDDRAVQNDYTRARTDEIRNGGGEAPPKPASIGTNIASSLFDRYANDADGKGLGRIRNAILGKNNILKAPLTGEERIAALKAYDELAASLYG